MDVQTTRIKVFVLCFIIEQGVLSARGQWILFADADGATTFSGFTKVEKSAVAAMKVI